MDCSTCRSSFSQSFDERLAGERRQEFVLHLQACQPCDAEFALYRRVFGTIRDLPDGEAKPFRAPSEVPGSLTRFAAPSAPPRFARIAAGILILIGLVGTHVLVFEWSRDHASRGRTGPSDPVATVSPPTLAAVQSLNSVFPSVLRDHVDAADLFLRTAEKLPDEPSARDVVAADWAVSKLPELTRRLTEDLRSGAFELPPEHKAWVEGYVQDAERDFVPRMQSTLGSGNRSVGEIRNAAALSPMCGKIDQLKLMTAAMQRGTSFRNQPMASVVLSLKDDGRRFIKYKHARLAGDLSQAIEGFEGFDAAFPNSRLSPAARYLQVEALNAAGNQAQAWTVVKQGICSQHPDQWRQLARQIDQFYRAQMILAPTWNEAHQQYEWSPEAASVLGGGVVSLSRAPSLWLVGVIQPQQVPLKSEACGPITSPPPQPKVRPKFRAPAARVPASAAPAPVPAPPAPESRPSPK
jgi:hypothetical protein